jgi:ABC-2 type transport system permease protein
MNGEKILIAYWTIVRREVGRFMRIWSQTLLPPVITTSLYFVIFGTFIGDRIGLIEGVDYIQFIVPGLVMLAVITSSYQNVVGSFFTSKFQRNLEELIVSPTPPWVVVAGYVTGGALRGLLVGFITLLVALFFTDISIKSASLMLFFAALTALLFSLAGLLNGIFAKGFDSISIFPTFVLTPLTYLGGIFYPISVLPAFWESVSLLNPVLYLVNGFRYSVWGISDVPLWASIAVLLSFTIGLAFLNVYLFRIGRGLRN